jgi:photosystem II stability/assembly factor-like uncharacterized protein
MWRSAPAGSGGFASQLAAASSRVLVIASSSDATFLYRSVDGGRRWRTLLARADGGLGWADLGFSNSRDGAVIYGPAISNGGQGRPGRLLLTNDGGLTWRTARL